MDVILFSAVRNNRRGKIGFLADFRRLNVAATRARHLLLVFGHGPTLEADEGSWRSLIQVGAVLLLAPHYWRSLIQVGAVLLLAPHSWHSLIQVGAVWLLLSPLQAQHGT